MSCVVRKAAVLLLSVLVSACGSIPKEAPELSLQLGKRIAALEEANINLLHQFFDLKRAELDKLMNEWGSDYIKARFETESMKKSWQIVVSENDPEQRNKFFYEVSTRIHQRISQERVKYMNPLDELERLLERRLRDEYAQTYAINNSLTSFLISANEVDENRNRYLEKVGIQKNDIADIVDKAGSIVNSLTTTIDSADKIQTGTQAYLEEMKKLINDTKSQFHNQ